MNWLYLQYLKLNMNCTMTTAVCVFWVQKKEPQAPFYINLMIILRQILEQAFQSVLSCLNAHGFDDQFP